MRTSMLTASLLALLAGGCMKKSEKYCAMHPDDAENCSPVDGSVGGTCTTRDDCMAPTPACDTANSTCVQCLANDDCTASTAPICSPTHTCGGCRFHSDCASLTCMPDGSCAAESDVAYVEAPTGAGGGVCTRQNPCGRVSQGVASLKKVIKLTGVNTENVTIRDRATLLTIVGDATARLVANNGAVLDVQGSTKLAVAGVTIGADTATATAGVVFAIASTGQIELRRVRVQNHNSGGIRILDGELRMFESTVYGNLGGGVSIAPTALVYTLRNNFIIGNGKSSGVSPGPSPFGGVLLEPDVGGTFEFNTVAINSSSGTRKPGIACTGPSNRAANNIVVNNFEATTGMTDGSQVNNDASACAFGNTVKLGNGAPLVFAAMGSDPPDFHLTAQSPTTVRDAAGNCAATVPTDVDGQSRPFNGACDLGADEYLPN